MRKYLKQRTRLLIIARDEKVHEQLVPILTGFEFYVDYFEDIFSAIDKFKAYRHPVVMIDEALVALAPQRTLSVFHKLQKNCMVVLLSQPESRPRISEILDLGAFDLLRLPINPSDVHGRIRRLLKHHQLIVSLNFLKLFVLVVFLIIPPVISLVWYLR